LDVVSTTKGFLAPRHTTINRDAIATPAHGLIIFNTTTNQLEVNTGTTSAPIWSAVGKTYTAGTSMVISGTEIQRAALTGDVTADANSNAITIASGAISTAKLADNAVTNSKIGEVISIKNGGTGTDMTATVGYVKQASAGANFSTVYPIPVADVSGAVRSVNGAYPAANGNVSVIISRVFTGATLDPDLATSIINASPAKKASDIYIIADGSNPNNGRTFIYDGTSWLEVATNLSTTDARYVNVAGDTMEGDLIVPTTKKITIADAPTNATDAANKDYVDTKIGGTGTINYVPKFSATKTLTNSSIFDNGTNVGIGTASPANKLEITQGTAGNSGLRFTNLNSSSAATTTASKVLGLNSTGDVILTNVPGTQNIVLFSTANPNSGSPTFTPAQPADQTVIYQSSIDNSFWTYNGTTYVTYTPPSTTPFSLASTNVDAGSNKSTAIWRSGNIGIGTSSPASNLHIQNSTLATATVNADANVFRMSRATTAATKWDNIAQFNLGSYSTVTAANSRLDLALTDGANSTTLSNVMTWQANGNVGIGTTAPTALLHLVSPSSGRMLIESLDGASGQASIDLKAGNFQSWRIIGQGSTNGGRFDFWNQTLNNSAMSISLSNNVGIGATAPVTKLVVNDNAYIANLPASSTNLMDNSTYRPLTRFQTTSGVNNNAISHYLTTTTAATQAHNYSTGAALHYVLQPAGGYVGIGTSAPLTLFTNASSGTNFVSSNNSTQGATGISWSTNTSGFNTSLYNSNNGVGSNGLQVKVANNSSLTLAFEVGQNAVVNGSSAPLFDVLGNGNVGIGTSSPAAQLHTTGSVRFAGAGTPGAAKVLTSDATGNATWQNANSSVTVSNKTADFTLTATDSGTVITVNSATTVTVTVPSTFSAGFYCQIIQTGAGQVNVVGSGVTVSSAFGLYSRTTNSSIGIMLATPTTAFLSGDTAF